MALMMRCKKPLEINLGQQSSTRAIIAEKSWIV
jgi:hypothetical protein